LHVKNTVLTTVVTSALFNRRLCWKERRIIGFFVLVSFLYFYFLVTCARLSWTHLCRILSKYG